MNTTLLKLASCFVITILATTVAAKFNALSSPTQDLEVADESLVRGKGGFQVRVQFDSEKLADQAANVADKTWAIASDVYGAELPTKPLVATLYRTNTDYGAAEQKLTGGAFKNNLAFAHYDSKTAHVALQPFLTDAGISDVGLPKLTARLLAHEMAHLVRYNWLPHSFADHPEWLVHGMASWIDKKVVRELGYVSRPMTDPDNGANIVQTKQLLERDKLPSVSRLLKNEKLEIGFYETYSVRWMFVDMLMTKYESEFSTFLKDFRRLGGGPGFAKRSSKLLLQHFNVDIAKLETDFREHIKRQEPVWVDHIRSLETGGDVWDQLAFPDSHAVAWQQTALPPSFEIATEATFLRATGHQLNLRIGQPHNFTQLSLTAGFGLNVFRFENKEWAMTLKKIIDGLKVGAPMKLKLTHDFEKDSLEFILNGVVIHQETLKLDDKARLGLVAQKGSAIAWKNLEISPRK